LKRYLKNTFYSGLFFALQMSATLVLTPFIIRNIGKASYGIIVTAGTLSLFGWFAMMDLGLQGALTKYLADSFRDGETGKQKSLTYLHSATSIFLLCGVISCIIVLVLSLFPGLFNANYSLHDVVTRSLWVVALFNLIIFPLLPVQATAEALQEYRLLKIASSFVLVLWLVAMVYLIYSKAAVYYLLIAEYLKTVSLLAIVWYCLKRQYSWLHMGLKVPRLSEFGHITNLSFDLLISRLTGIIFNQTDVLIITLLTGQLMLVTDYYSANAIFMAIVAITGVFNITVVSETAWLNESSDHLIELAVTGCRITAVIALPVAAVFFVWAPEILSAWLGPEYGKNQVLLRIFLISLIPIVATGVTSTILVGMNKLRGALWISILSIFINLLVSIGGFNILGIVSLGLGTTVAYWVGGFLYSRYCFRTLNTSIIKFYCRTMLLPLLISITYSLIGLYFKNKLTIHGKLEVVIVMVVSYIICLCTIVSLSTKELRENLLVLVGMR
jgi:O-antigen/teichoic acid export membrane protein